MALSAVRKKWAAPCAWASPRCGRGLLRTPVLLFETLDVIVFLFIFNRGGWFSVSLIFVLIFVFFRLIEFGDTPSGNLTLEEFQTLELEGEQDPPAFKRALAKQKEIDDKMVSEGNAIAGSGVFQELDSEEQADTNPLALPYHGDAMPQSSLPGTGLTQTNLMPHPLLEQAHAPINVTSDVQTWHQPNPNDSLSDDEDEEVSNVGSLLARRRMTSFVS